jgi:threonylcarbamoyladenosine tRNA methylthiotransferase MtaB
MPNQVSDDEKNRRADIIKKISRKKYIDFVSRNVGKACEVLIEKHRDRHNNNLKGVTRNYLTVQIVSDREDLYNSLCNVEITGFKDGIIHARLI